MYDFSGESNTSEISIEAGEILILTRTDVGEGWWEGTNSQGKTGLFPEAYVEIYKETQPPAMAPPINPMINQTKPNFQTNQGKLLFSIHAKTFTFTNNFLELLYNKFFLFFVFLLK